jgi:hypothetical protein
MVCVKDQLELRLPADLGALAGERVFNRLRSLARVIGRSPVLAVEPV